MAFIRSSPLSGPVAVAGYLILMPLAAVTIDRIGGHDLARSAQVMLGLVCALALWPRDTAESAPRLPASHRVLLTAGALLALASTLQAAVPAMAFREAALFAGLAAVARVVSRVHDPLDLPARVASIASAGYVAVILLLLIAGYLAGQPLNRGEIIVGYDNYRFYNHVQSAALPATVLALTLAPRGSWARRIAAFASVGGFALLYAVAGRGTLLGLAVAAALSGLLFGRSALALLRLLALSALAGLVLFALLFWWLPLLLGITVEFSDSYYGARMGSVEARLYLWGVARTYIEHSPWLGIGPMHYAHLHNPEAAHPHNIVLQIAAEWGLPMLGLVLAAAGTALWRFAVTIRRCADVRQRDCGIGLFLACAAIAVDGLFSGNFVMPVSQVWIAFTFGWALAWTRRQQGVHEVSGSPAPRAWRRAAAAGLVVTQLWLVWNVWPELVQLDKHVKQVLERHPNPTMNPRFWSHGWF